MKKLTNGQAAVLIAATLPMIAVGIAGGIGTYSNISNAYGSNTAIGALAAGEGATAVLAFILLGVTLLGQGAPKFIHTALWVLPGIASVMAATAATKGTGQTVVYAVTPMAMTAAAEGLAFLARRIVVYRTGVDVQAQQRDAQTLKDLNWHQARADHHDSKRARKASRRKAWRLAKRVATHDATLGDALSGVQRARIVEGADNALAAMFRNTPALPSVTPDSDARQDCGTPATPDRDAGRRSVAEDAQQAGEATSQSSSGSVDAHADDALALFTGDTPRSIPETPRNSRSDKVTVAAQQPRATAVHQRITTDLEDAIEDAMRAVADDPTVQLLTVAEVAKQKNVTPGTVRSWVNRGKLTPASRDADGRLRFHPNTVAELD